MSVASSTVSRCDFHTGVYDLAKTYETAQQIVETKYPKDMAALRQYKKEMTEGFVDLQFALSIMHYNKRLFEVVEEEKKKPFIREIKDNNGYIETTFTNEMQQEKITAEAVKYLFSIKRQKEKTAMTTFGNAREACLGFTATTKLLKQNRMNDTCSQENTARKLSEYKIEMADNYVDFQFVLASMYEKVKLYVAVQDGDRSSVIADLMDRNNEDSETVFLQDMRKEAVVAVEYLKSIEQQKKNDVISSFDKAIRACIGFTATKKTLNATDEYKELSSAKKAFKTAVRRCLVDEGSLMQMMKEINGQKKGPLKSETREKIAKMECGKSDV
jgi:hypothetical protein